MKNRRIVIIALIFLFALAAFGTQGFNTKAYAQEDAFLLEQKIVSRATLEDDFVEGSIIVTLNRDTTRRFLKYPLNNNVYPDSGRN